MVINPLSLSLRAMPGHSPNPRHMGLGCSHQCLARQEGFHTQQELAMLRALCLPHTKPQADILSAQGCDAAAASLRVLGAPEINMLLL